MNNKIIIKISKKFYRPVRCQMYGLGTPEDPLKAKKLLNWTAKTNLNTIIK